MEMNPFAKTDKLLNAKIKKEYVELSLSDIGDSLFS